MKNLNLAKLYNEVELVETDMVSLNDHLLQSVKGGLKIDVNIGCTSNTGCGPNNGCGKIKSSVGG